MKYSIYLFIVNCDDLLQVTVLSGTIKQMIKYKSSWF